MNTTFLLNSSLAVNKFNKFAAKAAIGNNIIRNLKVLEEMDCIFKKISGEYTVIPRTAVK